MTERGTVRWCLVVGGSAIAVSVVACSGQIEGTAPRPGVDAGDAGTVTVDGGHTPPPPPEPYPIPGTKDAGIDGSKPDEPGTCKIESASFVPPVMNPPAPSQPAACTDSQISALADACAKEPEGAGCKTARELAANKNCSDCLFGNKTDAYWKMVVLDPGGTPAARFNQAGCIELASGVQNCGKDYFTIGSCFDAYCGDCTGSELTSCQKDVAQGSGECKGYLIGQACGNALDAVEKTCFASESTDASIKAMFVSMARVFCRKSG